MVESEESESDLWLILRSSELRMSAELNSLEVMGKVAGCWWDKGEESEEEVMALRSTFG